MNWTTQHTHIRTTMDNNEDNDKYINVGDELASVDVSMKGVITLRFKDPNKAPIVYDFSDSDEESDQSSQEKSEVKDRTEDSRQPSLETQAKRAMWKGDYITLRQIIDKKGLPAHAVIPETGRTLLQELCATGSDEGFADCLRVLVCRGVDLRRRVAGTNGTILHLLAEHGSLLKWDRVIDGLGESLMDELLCATDNEGNTPLHSAAERGRMDIYTLVAGLCGPDSAQSELENKHGKKPHEVLNATRYSDMVYAEESQRIMLQHMMRYFYNVVHHRTLYSKTETELE